MSKHLIKKSFLHSGNPLPITKTLCLKHPTLQEILDIDQEHFGLYSEELYYQMISVFLTDPYQYMVYLDDKDIDYQAVDAFDVFIMVFLDYMDRIEHLTSEESKEVVDELYLTNPYFEAFRFFLNVDIFYVVKDDSNDYILVDRSQSFLMNRSTFHLVYDFIKQMNGIEDPEKIDPEDAFGKKLLIEDEREKLKNPKSPSTSEDNAQNRLGNLISSVTWVGNGGITPFNRNQLHMYDLVDGLQRTHKYLNFQNTMTGVYSGCIDGQKLDTDTISWAN